MATGAPLEVVRPLDQREQAIATRFRERVLAALDGRVERIVLFGSHARGRVVDHFKAAVRRRRMTTARAHAKSLEAAFELRLQADYGNDDLTEAAARLRTQVEPFLAFSRSLVDEASDPAR